MSKYTIVLTPLLTAFLLASASPLAFAATGGVPSAKERPQAAQAAPEAEENRIQTQVAGSYLSSQYARSQGNIDQAIVYLRRVYQRQPENYQVAAQLQGMLLLQGSVEEAAMLAESIQRGERKDPLADLVLALRAVRHGHMKDASIILQAARDSGNMQLWVPLLMGWAEQAEGQLKQPLTKDVFAADIGRAVPLVNYHLALINAHAGFTEAAVQNFLDSVEDAQNAPPRVMDKLTRFYHANGQPKQLAALVQAYERQTAGLPPEKSPSELNGATDGIAEVLYTMGGIMFGAGVVNDAAIYMQLATYTKPDFAEAHLALGDAFAELEQYARSIAAYGEITPDNPLYLKAQLHIAVNYDRMGKLKEGLALLDKLDRQNPQNGDAIVTKGDLYRIHGQYEKAIEAYSQALKRIPQLQSSDWPILFARGSCLERLGRWKEAEKDLQAALELKPDQPDILNYLGFAQLEHGENLDSAREMITRAVEARPNDAQIIDSMGWALYLQGDYDSALAYMEKAVELLPGDPTVNDHLGDVYWRLGRKTEARFQWNRVLAYSPEPRLADSIQKKLKDGLPVATIATSATYAEGEKSSATP